MCVVLYITLIICTTQVIVFTLLHMLIISHSARRWKIIICTMCVRGCVRECVTQFSLKLLQLHIFGKLLVLMNFYTLQFLGGFGELWSTFE